MTIKYLEQYNSDNVIVSFQNTGKEAEGTLLFVNQVGKYIQDMFNKNIYWIEYRNDKNGYVVVDYNACSRNGEPFSELISKRNYLPNIATRFCTQELKIRPLKKFCKGALGWKNWTNIVGIRYDEPRRYAKAQSVKEVYDIEHPLVKWKVTKEIVLEYWAQMPFDLQIKDYQGNCDVCFLKGSKKKQQIARENPKAFDWWIEQEKKVGGTFVKHMPYEKIKDFVLRQPTLSFDDTVDCFCNVD